MESAEERKARQDADAKAWNANVMRIIRDQKNQPAPDRGEFAALILKTAKQVNSREVGRMRKSGTLDDELEKCSEAALRSFRSYRDSMPDMEAMSLACRMNPLIYLGDVD